jgi:hypothetical protein
MEVPMKTDPAARSDFDELTALNCDYIHSVQHGDVQRFDELLAEDFLCSNPDGSLVGKNQFLAQSPRPATISGLSVQEVRVRILGEVAIIHARTSYTTVDGEQRNGRYTRLGAPGWGRERRLRAVALCAFRGNPAEIHRCHQGAPRLGLFKSKDAQPRHERFGFIASPSEPFRLFVLIKDTGWMLLVFGRW